ncbi:MAG: amidase domain-containing protein [Candidatus Hydrogenedentota bacterium]
MKIKTILAFVILLIGNFITILSYGYDRNAAVAYANKFYSIPNSQWFEVKDEDCANFGSQCVIAGNLICDKSFAAGGPTINYKQGNGYTFEQARDLAWWLINSGLAEEKGYRFVGQDKYMPGIGPGDIIIWIKNLGTPQEEYFHTLVVTNVIQGKIEYACHTVPPLKGDLDTNYHDKHLYYLHLKDAPIIKYFKLEGDAGYTITEWKYDDDYTQGPTMGEYYKNTYNGLNPTPLDPDRPIWTVTSGGTKITALFDCEMEQTEDVMMVAPEGINNDFVYTGITSGAWTIGPNSKWQAKFTKQWSDLTNEQRATENIKTWFIVNKAKSTDGSLIDEDNKLNKYSVWDKGYGKSHTEELKLDNFLPYLVKMEVFQNNEQKYLSEWVWDGSQMKQKTTKNDFLKCNQEIVMSLYFSEGIKQVQNEISIINDHTYEIRKVFSNLSDEQVVMVEAIDYASNELYGKPENIPTISRNNQGVWVYGPKKDMNHKIKFLNIAKLDFGYFKDQPEKTELSAYLDKDGIKLSRKEIIFSGDRALSRLTISPRGGIVLYEYSPSPMYNRIGRIDLAYESIPPYQLLGQNQRDPDLSSDTGYLTYINHTDEIFKIENNAGIVFAQVLQDLLFRFFPIV